MLRVLSFDLWPTISRLSATADRKHAAVAYVMSDEHVRFGKGDVLVTDASDEAVKASQTSAKVLRAAYERGAHLYSLSGLHAKIVCLGRFAVVGSANLSVSSVESLVEAAVVTDHPGLLAEARATLTQIQEAATRIDESFLDRITAIPVTSVPFSKPARPILSQNRASRTWVVGVHPLDEDRYESEVEFVEEGERMAESNLEHDNSAVSWIRFTGTSKFRREAQRGDTVLQIWRRKPKAKTANVYFPAPIIHRQDEPTCTRFYVEAFSDEDERAISWKEFARVWTTASSAEVPPLGAVRLMAADVAERILAAWPSASGS
jgi:phospholipase D-like protein